MDAHVRLSKAISVVALAGVFTLILSSFSQAQVTATPGAGSLNTQVNKVGNVYEITQGTRAGSNLFHSFESFSVAAVETARFQTINLVPDATVGNVLGRVTGGNPSSILGTIDSASFYPSANLFLMNPAGILFGPNASLNVGGSATFTEANYIRLTDNVRFTALPSAQDVLLSTAPVVAFGFLDANPQGNTITVGGSTLSVPDGQMLSFIGKDFTMTGGRLSAPGGQVRIASVASAGEILHQDLGTGPNINGDTFTAMGNIALSQGATVDVSADAAGTIKIRGGQFMISDATLSADTVNTNGGPMAVDILLTGDLTISDTRAAPAITAITTGTGDAGDVHIASANVQATSTDPNFVPFALIDAHSSGDGSAANVNMTTGNLSVTGPAASWHFIDSGMQGPGPGGNITIIAQTIDLTGTTISTGSQLAEVLGFEPSGPAGNLTFIGDSLHISDVILATTATFTPVETHRGGDIRMNVREINMLNTQVATDAFGGRGGITMNGDTLVTDATVFSAFTALGPGGGITFNGRILELTNGSSFITTTSGDFTGGDIRVTATDHVSLIGASGNNPLGQFVPSGFFSNSVGFFGTQGHSGNVFVTTPSLLMVEGRINTITKTSGPSGNVTINAGTVSISGEFSTPDLAQGTFFDVGPLRPSGIFTSTIGSEFCTGPCGAAGNITANVGSLFMGPGSHIDSGTTNNGLGGTITINAGSTISMSGTLSNGDPVGLFSRTTGMAPDSGIGGDINASAGQSFTINNGAEVSVSSTGPANAGNIFLNGGNQFLAQNSSVTATATQAGGGNIKIQTAPSGTVQLTNSTVSSSVLGGPGGGGDVNIDPQFVILQNSQILAQAVQGNGGNINITTQVFLADANSVVSASSQFGVNGTVNIQSPTSQLSGRIVPLPQSVLQTTPLLQQRCEAKAAGDVSSFVMAGRETLPTEPGGWLGSPLYAAGERPGAIGDGNSLGSGGDGLTADAGLWARGYGLEGETQIVSLRRVTPAGFLTQAFPVDWSGCSS
jgi:filamentous hemagglutinin family protein